MTPIPHCPRARKVPAARPLHGATARGCLPLLRVVHRPLLARPQPAALSVAARPGSRRCASRAPPAHTSAVGSPTSHASPRSHRRYQPPPSRLALLRQTPGSTSAGPTRLWWQNSRMSAPLPRANSPNPAPLPPPNRPSHQLPPSLPPDQSGVRAVHAVPVTPSLHWPGAPLRSQSGFLFVLLWSCPSPLRSILPLLSVAVVLGGRLAIEHTTLALFQRLEAQWLLGVR